MRNKDRERLGALVDAVKIAENRLACYENELKESLASVPYSDAINVLDRHFHVYIYMSNTLANVKDYLENEL